MPPIDLTPFGFTQTENLVYDALTGLGPASVDQAEDPLLRWLGFVELGSPISLDNLR